MQYEPLNESANEQITNPDKMSSRADAQDLQRQVDMAQIQLLNSELMYKQTLVMKEQFGILNEIVSNGSKYSKETVSNSQQILSHIITVFAGQHGVKLNTNV